MSKKDEAPDHLDSHDLNYLVDEPSPRLSLDEQAQRMITEDLHDIPLTLEQTQATEGILRSWLVQIRTNHPDAHLDLGMLDMLRVIQAAQNVFADYLNAYYDALRRAEESGPVSPSEEVN